MTNVIVKASIALMAIMLAANSYGSSAASIKCVNLNTAFIRQHLTSGVFKLQTDKPVRINSSIECRDIPLEIESPSVECSSNVLAKAFSVKTTGSFVNRGNIKALRDISVVANTVQNVLGSKIHAIGNVTIKASDRLINEGAKKFTHQTVNFSYYMQETLPQTVKFVDVISPDINRGLEQKQIEWPSVGYLGRLAQVIPVQK